MADFYPVADLVKPPDPNQAFTSMNNILGLQQRRLGIESTQQALQIQAQELQQKDLQTQQQQGVQSFFQQWDPNDHLSADGTTDTESVHNSNAYKSAGNAKPLIDQTLIQIKQGQYQNKQSLATLNGTLVKQYSEGMGSLASDEDVKAGNIDGQAKVKAQLALLSQQSPDMARIAQGFGNVLQRAPTDPTTGNKKNLAHLVQSQQLMGADILGQRSQQNPQQSNLDTGGQIQQQNRDVQSGDLTPNGPPVNKSIPPGYMQAPNGSIVRADSGGLSEPSVRGPGGGTPQGNAGGVAPTRALGPSGAPAQTRASSGSLHPRLASEDAPPINAPKAIQDAYAVATKGANDHVESIRQADNPLDYGNNMQIANQIRKLSKDTATGPGTEAWHNAMGVLGAPVGMNNVADYQLLGAYLDRQAAGIRGAMGLPQTNEGATQSRDIAGNTRYQGKALQDKNDLTQALTEGLHQYRNGLDRVAGFSGQASPQAINQFKSAWTQNFDPNVFKGELAYKRSQKEGDEFVRSLDLSPADAKSFKAKRAALQGLARGELPQ